MADADHPFVAPSCVLCGGSGAMRTRGGGRAPCANGCGDDVPPVKAVPTA